MNRGTDEKIKVTVNGTDISDLLFFPTAESFRNTSKPSSAALGK